MKTQNTTESETSGSDDYQVGYGRPPKHSRFRKGKSGNPKGKKKGRRSTRTIAREVFSERLPMQMNGRKINAPMDEALIRKTLADALNGDRHARSAALQLLERYGYHEDESTPASVGNKLLDIKTMLAVLTDFAENGPAADFTNPSDDEIPESDDE